MEKKYYTSEEEFRNGIVNLISNLSTKESLELFDNYCIAIDKKENIVYSMDQLDEELSIYAPSEIVKCISHDNFNYDDKFFYFDKYGNLYSTNNIVIDISEIASYIIDNHCALNNEKIEQYIETTPRIMQFDGEELKLDRICKCDWCEVKTLVGITHYGIKHYGATTHNRLICAYCAKIIEKHNKIVK